VWAALTEGELTKKYFHEESIESDFKRGSKWHSVGPSGSRDVEGEVLESDPPHRLVITWHILYDASLARELSRVTYLIEKRGDACKLTVLHDCSEAPLTAKHVSEDGWQWVLSNLKTFLETGAPLPTLQAQ